MLLVRAAGAMPLLSASDVSGAKKDDGPCELACSVQAGPGSARAHAERGQQRVGALLYRNTKGHGLLELADSV